ncbi:MAG: tRNA dihydrouridine synthase DusB [Chloroflexi bacterium]|nr:tRNA-dihydrouridine synthase [Ardenticatenaceae bacterium]MBL1129200.1 tRNA dihydrouridine synthase DusB [Chloroflexota bacterium]NOG35276.1 tRNA dihydrouridine synthase DusB [Chloroflexota bacterium]GIK58437.1 MAG: tRNA-dihydrouridine synthase [Chloroflexota bacterium]
MMVEPKPLFRVGIVPVYGDVILSPMAGYSDVPYRALCRAYGSAMHYTEFVPVEVLLGRQVAERFRMRLDKQPGERPMVFQIFGNDARLILQAAQRIVAWGPDVIDVNMGCSTRKVSGRGAGVGMMPQPALVAETFRLLSTHLPIPVTGKIRLGWDATQQNYLEIARIMEDNGAALIAMHGRTKSQKYDGRADWDAIACLKQTVSVPVIGNGDVQSPADIDRMKAHTGCDAVMIGRAAIGNPWIFARRSREDVGLADVVTAVRRHAYEMARYYGESYGLRQFRKHLKQYAAGFPELETLLPTLFTATTLAEFEQYLMRIEIRDWRLEIGD